MSFEFHTLDQLKQAVQYYTDAVEELRKSHGDQYADESLAAALLKMFEDILALEQMEDDEALEFESKNNTKCVCDDPGRDNVNILYIYDPSITAVKRHDYGLCTVCNKHIEISRVIQSPKLIKALMDNNVIGFPTDDDRKDFERSIENTLSEPSSDAGES